MRAMVLHKIGEPLALQSLPDPLPGQGEVRLRVEACGVCRTDLHVVDGELPGVVMPVIPGHECVGVVDAIGPGVTGVVLGERMGVPWLGGACGHCEYCRTGRENLCDEPSFTGYTRPGGFASHIVARADYCVRLPADADPVALAPLLCAGLIGWRCLKKAGSGKHLGLYGFGAAAHIIAQVARSQQRDVYAFTRSGDTVAQAFARSLGASWAGASEELPPVPLDAAILFAPVGALVPQALRAVKKGGRVVCGGIHMSDIPSFPYRWLWEEREVVSVANLTRADAREFFADDACSSVHTSTQVYPLEQANQALNDLRDGRLSGAAVLRP
ncbi:MAG: zinc-dependent alcohol dehydrogenase family protein [Dyella sp.]|uniref:zinc-dependent alcohol dehydrogenase family protein n=1 Tax=Dyella sp. TaxID=1869338 RepID=UPI003F81E57C